jgi:hypothetical protein
MNDCQTESTPTNQKPLTKLQLSKDSIRRQHELHPRPRLTALILYISKKKVDYTPFNANWVYAHVSSQLAQRHK